MVHGDDKGAVIPPRVCAIQVALIPVGVTAETSSVEIQHLIGSVEHIGKSLMEVGVRIKVDTRLDCSLEQIIAEYEITGVPLRLQISAIDIEKGTVPTFRRDTNEEGVIKISDITEELTQLLETIQKDMYNRAKDTYLSHRIEVTNWSDIVPQMDNKNVVLIPHCLDGECADQIKKETADMCERPAQVDDRALSMGAKGKHCRHWTRGRYHNNIL
jgi:prolyl-tRNA synthetase